VCRAERMHPVVLADITEKHHSSPFVACLDGCLPILYASEFAEPSVVSAQQSAGPDRAIASLPFPLPTYATDVLLGGMCIFQRQRVRAIELLNIGLVVLWRELRLLCPLAKVITPGDEFLQLL
jgi:hypothetical protein